MRTSDAFEPNSCTFIVLGTMLLWISWLFYNGGSSYDMFQPRGNSVSKSMMNTVMGGASGGLMSIWIKPALETL